jgi:RTX calcium-binding nonapeptide repeat (4 copies)
MRGTILNRHEATHANKPRRGRLAIRLALPLGAAAALVAGQLLLASPASAASGTLVQSGFGFLSVEAAHGKANNIVLTSVGPGQPATVRDHGDIVKAGAGCVQLDAHTARCDNVATAVIKTDDQSDLVTAQVPLQVNVLAGDGNDPVFTGAGPDFIDAGPSNDLLNSGAGDDGLDCGDGIDRGDGGLDTDNAINCETTLNVP